MACVDATSGRDSLDPETCVLEKLRFPVYVLCKLDGGMLAEYSCCKTAGEHRSRYPKASEKEDRAMKWGGFSREGERKMKKLLSGKAMYVLLTIAAAALVMLETLKWRPG